MSIGNAAAHAAEFTPATLRAVAQAVVDQFTAITWSHIGIKGNDAHYGGYHRSLRWCRVSRGRGVDYSDQISRDTSQINTRRKDALRALDITAPASVLIPMCSRVDWAMRHGLIDDVREWYGNDDGDNRVDGYDNFFNEVVSSDDSHLWHLHLSLYTDTVEGPHDRLIAVLLGTPGWNQLEDEMSTAADAEIHQIAVEWRHLINGWNVVLGKNHPSGKDVRLVVLDTIEDTQAQAISARTEIAGLTQMVRQALTGPTGPLDDAQFGRLLGAVREASAAAGQQVLIELAEQRSARLAAAEAEAGALAQS